MVYASWGTYEKTFYVTGVGKAYCSGNFIGLSDESIKSDIKSIESPLSIIQQLQGVSYKNDLREKIKKDHINNITEKDRAFVGKDSLYDKVYADKLMAEYDKRDMGLIAQQVEKVLPDIVYTINGDKKGIAYTQFIALLIEGVKEQQKQINTLFETVATLQGLSETKSLSLGSANIVTSMNAQTKTEIRLLEQNTPNPFSMQTQISYYLPSKVTDAQLRLYNLNGHQLRSIKLTERGYGNITIMANELEAGIYLYSLIVEGKEISCKRMILTD